MRSLSVTQIVMRRLVGCGVALALFSCAHANESGQSADPGNPSGYSVSDGGQPPADACTSGDRWPTATTFEFAPSPAPADARACTPHCGENPPSSRNPHVLTTKALPFGACSSEAGLCTMRAEHQPDCSPGYLPVGPVDLYICTCEANRWECRIDTSQQSATNPSCDAASPTVDGG